MANEGLPLTSDPANTPFTTGVGGTVLYSDGNEPAGRAVERAWEYSGGNSSPFIRAPDYQQGVGQPQPPVRGRQNGQPTNTGQLCRGVPDVAALSGDAVANGYTIVSDGQDAGGGGTSLSSPLWAGMWADLLSTAPPGATYGFANPSIYAIAKDPARYAAAFTDITAGANGLNPALTGYDYVTGFGAPRLAGLISQVQAVTGIAGRAPGTAASACTDRSAPVSKFARRRAVKASRKRLSLTGTASDRGCRADGAGRVKRGPRGGRAAGGQALSLPGGQEGLLQAAQLLEADLHGGEGHDALALRLPRAPGQGPLSRLRPGHRRRRERRRASCPDGIRASACAELRPARPRAARWPPRWPGAARRSSAAARRWCARAGRPSAAGAGRGAAATSATSRKRSERTRCVGASSSSHSRRRSVTASSA